CRWTRPVCGHISMRRGHVSVVYRDRNTVERGYARLKRWRGIATRYDKYALTFGGGVLLAAIVINYRVHNQETRPGRRTFGGRVRRYQFRTGGDHPSEPGVIAFQHDPLRVVPG